MENPTTNKSESETIVKVVLIGDQTVANVKQLLQNCLNWLDRDAQFAHPNSKVKQFRRDVHTTLTQIREDEQRFLGKKFQVETPGDYPLPDVENPSE